MVDSYKAFYTLYFRVVALSKTIERDSVLSYSPPLFFDDYFITYSFSFKNGVLICSLFNTLTNQTTVLQ